MLNVVVTYKTTKGGIVQIDESDAGWRKSGKEYSAWWTYDFLSQVEVTYCGRSSNLEFLRAKLFEWDPNLERIEDLGDWVLYMRTTPEGRDVFMTPFADALPVKARDVPLGSRLLWNTVYFFVFYRKDRSVVRENILVK